jgi:hypothetical protein
MTLNQDLVPYKPEFPGILDSYHKQIKEAINQNKHHDHRRHLFMNFLEKGFNVEPEEITIEEKVKAANVRGYIDALYKFIIFEFKSELDTEREAAKIEIKKYFKSRPKPAEFLAVVSDGLIFEVYQYEHEDIALIKDFVLDARNPLDAHRFFDDIILVTKKVTPKSVDIATRFGLTSAVFNKIRVKLETLFEKVHKHSSVKVKYREWNSLLAKVYGEGEWKVRQHGWSKRRTWRKFHLGINEATGTIEAAEVTGNGIADCDMLEPLLRQVRDTIDQLSADGAYDKRKCYDILEELGIIAAIPPQKNAKIWHRRRINEAPHARDENLRRIREIGRDKWKEEVGYHRRSLAENTMYRFKTAFGDIIASRVFSRQRTEVLLKCKILNKMTLGGMPDSYIVA